MLSLYLIRSGTSSQWSSTCNSCVRPRSYFRLPLTTRAAAFITRCNLLVVDFGARIKRRSCPWCRNSRTRLTVWWALRTPQRRSPKEAKHRAPRPRHRRRRGKRCPPPQPTIGPASPGQNPGQKRILVKFELSKNAFDDKDFGNFCRLN